MLGDGPRFVTLANPRRVRLHEDGRVCEVLPPPHPAEDEGDDEWTVATRTTLELTPNRIHEWAFRIRAGARDVSLGICYGRIVMEGDIRRNDKRRLDVFGGTGEIVGPGDAQRDSLFGGGFDDGDLVHFRYDPFQRALYFGINGVWLVDPIFSKLPPHFGWFPYCAFGWHGVVLAIEELQEPM